MKIQFIAKAIPLPRRPDNWRVYDTTTASFPYRRHDLGLVTQDVPKAEAQAEANRLNTLTGGSP